MTKIRITRLGYQPNGHGRKNISIRLSREEIQLAQSTKPLNVGLSTWIRRAAMERAAQERDRRRP